MNFPLEVMIAEDTHKIQKNFSSSTILSSSVTTTEQDYFYAHQLH